MTSGGSPPQPADPLLSSPSPKDSPMARRLIAVLAQALRERSSADPVHFHQGAMGQPVVCYDDGCASPRLTVH